MKHPLHQINSILIMLIVSIPFSLYAGPDISTELYKEKKYEEAFLYYNELSEVGNAQAMYNIGIMYFKGEGVKRDLPRAYAWMSVANERLSKEEYKQTAAEIFNSLFESEQKTALELATELNARFSNEGVNDNLAPKPLSDMDCTQDVSPINRANPDYPKSEENKGRMGTVEFEYTISPEGYVRDVIITSATSSDFENEAVKVLPTWRYSPRIVNNKAIPTQRRLVFVFLIEISYKYTNADKLNNELRKTRNKAESGDVVAGFNYGLMLNRYRHFKSILKNINFEYQESNKWYLASAVGGITNAQYYLGRNMMQGFGCEIDEQAGTKWLRSAAIGGYSPAQRFMAVKMIDNPDEQKYREAVKFLKFSVEQDDYYPTKILLAWEYATSLLDDVRNGPAALDLLKSEPKNYYDSVRIKETEAAAYAEAGDYAKAVSIQNSALKEAQKFGWDIAEMQSRLQSYKDSMPWRGEYYVSISPPPDIDATGGRVSLKPR